MTLQQRQTLERVLFYWLKQTYSNVHGRTDDPVVTDDAFQELVKDFVYLLEKAIQPPSV